MVLLRSKSAIPSAWSRAVEAHKVLQGGGTLASWDPNHVPLPQRLYDADERALAVLPPGALDYARYSTATVTYGGGGPLVVVGSPQFLTGFTLGTMVMRARARRQARRAAAAQWRPATLWRTMVTTHRVWCEIAEPGGPTWRFFNHDTITGLQLRGRELTVNFSQSEPLRLCGDWAPWCATVIAHHRFGVHTSTAVPELHAALTG